VPAVNEAQRAALIEANRPLVFKAVRLIWPRVEGHIEKRELVSLGDLGLVEAASRFDPDGGASFATFAWYRVQGAILDGIRRSTAIPRRVWAQLCALRAASEVLESRAAQEAAARTRGAAPPSTEARLHEVKEAMAAIETVYALSARASLDDIVDTAADPAHAPERFATAALGDRLDAALAQLPAKERTLVQKHYFEGKNLLEAGQELGISKSWASRLHAQAVERLRRHLRGAADP
jgi:RNA polymerase sigma factor for flagellar operon FliA